MGRLAREPLLHFVVLGATVFAADAFLRQGSGERGVDEIVVSPGRIENLAALFAKTRQRAPTETELRIIVDDYVLEEAFYREGMALGVDRDDAVIRRRVRQKMRFFVGESADAADPDDSELEAWLAENAESYRRPSRFTFRQIYLSPELRGGELSADVERVLASLREPAGATDPRALGDPSRLAHAHEDAEAGRVAGDFGQGFADRLAELPNCRPASGPGRWSRPSVFTSSSSTRRAAEICRRWLRCATRSSAIGASPSARRRRGPSRKRSLHAIA